MIATTWLRMAVFIAAPSFLSAPNLWAEQANNNLSTPATAEFCSTITQIESVLSSSIPLVVLPPEVARQVANFQRETVEPLFAKAKQIAPRDITDAVNTYAKAKIAMLSTLNFSVTQTAAFAMADDAIDNKMLADCGFETMPVTAVNYEYLGITETRPKGATALTLTNESDEVHEISIARINDDVNLSAKEILSLPEAESLASIKLVGYAEVPPGGSETTFINFDNGRYYAVCFTPEGSMSLHAFGDGAPHLFHGMIKEFTVGDSIPSQVNSTPFNPSARSTPKELFALLGQYIDARDLDGILSIHEPNAGVVEWTGKVARGTAAIRQVYIDFFATQPILKTHVGQIIEADGVAIILGDYTLELLGRNGNTINTQGKFGDMVRQQPDGTWLYLLDNPYAP